ncbi:hypothetical protein [Streptomyces sp. BBFR109]|uniref:hypothetical protein n=1 Tax=Streptomyces sp. BBFR109 TaxID=3448172 RepID=UPI003F7696C1
MTDSGGGKEAPVRRSRLADYAELTGPPRQQPLRAPAVPPEGQESPEDRSPVTSETAATPADRSVPAEASYAEAEVRRQEFIAALEAFRDTAVLVPVRDDGWLTADFGGVRWILAFSDKAALARYALARAEGREEWTYETVLGARLLDVAVPEAGVPCGVALDAADGAEHALLLPPVAGIVPEMYAVNRQFVEDAAEGGRFGAQPEARW